VRPVLAALALIAVAVGYHHPCPVGVRVGYWAPTCGGGARSVAPGSPRAPCPARRDARAFKNCARVALRANLITRAWRRCPFPLRGSSPSVTATMRQLMGELVGMRRGICAEAHCSIPRRLCHAAASQFAAGALPRRIDSAGQGETSFALWRKEKRISGCAYQVWTVTKYYDSGGGYKHTRALFRSKSNSEGRAHGAVTVRV